jgi:predicted negative regulator of RcsB-dependent stress response
MAESKDVSKPKEPPKPVHIGGESLVDRILPYLRHIIIGALALAFVVVAVLGVRWWKHRGQHKETAKIAEVMRIAQRPVAFPGMPKDDNNPAFADPADRAKALLQALNEQDASPPGHAFRASLLLAAGDVDKAIEEYRRGQAAAGLEGVLSREGLGIALEAKATAEKDAAAKNKLLEEALAVFQRMQPAENGPRRVYALYHQGRILDERLLNRKAEAKTAFEKADEILQKEPRHELRELVQKRLAALGAV